MPSTNDPVRQARWDRNLEYIDSRRDVPCYDCGGRFPLVCMDLHHIDESIKGKFYGSSIKNTLKDRSRKRIDEELDKCVVLCANCHRVRHS
jgi:hypothetical protein